MTEVQATVIVRSRKGFVFVLQSRADLLPRSSSNSARRQGRSLFLKIMASLTGIGIANLPNQVRVFALPHTCF